jgi:hypothetical protein
VQHGGLGSDLTQGTAARIHQSHAVYTDNETAIALSANTVKHSTMKQISLKYFLAKDLSDLSVTVTGRIDTSENPADLGTKPLGF